MNSHRDTRTIFCALRWFIAFAFLATAMHAETRLDLGGSYVQSDRLGYESPYAGVRAEVGVERGRFVSRALVAAYDAQKIGRSGHGLRSSLLAGCRFTDWLSVSGGAIYLDQVSDGLHKSGLAPAVEVELRLSRVALRVGAHRMREPDDRQDVYSAEVTSLGRLRLFGRYERVKFESQFASGSGSRFEVGVTYRAWRAK